MGESNDVFISYNWNIKQQVEVLERRLNEKDRKEKKATKCEE